MLEGSNDTRQISAKRKKRNSTHPATFQKGVFLKLTIKIPNLKTTFLFESMTHKIIVRQTTSFFFFHWLIMQVTRNNFCNFYFIFLKGNLKCLFLVQLPFWIYNKVFKFFHYCTEMLKLQHFLWKHKRLLVRNKKIALILKKPD